MNTPFANMNDKCAITGAHWEVIVDTRGGKEKAMKIKLGFPV